MLGDDAMAMLAAMLDASTARIAALAADARYFDRQAVAVMADIWDNNTLPLFGAALSRPVWTRQRRARAALRWMADLAPDRRAWMIAQAGPLLEPLLPAARTGGYRDYRGHVAPVPVPLTPAAEEDYDLSGAVVTAVRVERAGPDLVADVQLTVARRFPAPDDRGVAQARLSLRDVRRVDLAGIEVRAGARPTSGPCAAVTVDDTGVEVHFGAVGRLRAASATIWLDDASWHLSRAGRAADAVTPSRSALAARRPEAGTARPQRHSAGWDAALVLREAMLQVRSVRYDRCADGIPLRELRVAFTDAGQGILTAAAQPVRHRDRAFRALARQWLADSPTLARRSARWFPAGHWLHSLAPALPSPVPSPRSPGRAQLTLLGWGAGRAGALVTLAAPEADGSWGLRCVTRSGRLSVSHQAFTTDHSVTEVAGRSFALGDALTIVS